MDTSPPRLTPRKLFLSNGGFDEDRFAVAYNDADYGYRLIDAGYRCVYCGEAELFHSEVSTRGLVDKLREVAAYRDVHGRRTDPYLSPHLDPNSSIFGVRPNVVPVRGGPARIPLLAVTHNLNWEGARWVQFELLRLSLAKCSPWVHRGLPTFDEMVENCRKTFVAAAESAVPGWDESFSPTIPRTL
jgi:hypothetical protein